MYCLIIHTLGTFYGFIRIAWSKLGHCDCSPSGMTNILLIEDNEVDRFIAERHLALSGLDASMQSVTNGKLALEALRQEFLNSGSLPDIILVDWFMPVMNGMDFINAFQQANLKGKEKVNIFLLTSLADPNLYPDPALHRIAGVVEKPITTESFKQVILQASREPRSSFTG